VQVSGVEFAVQIAAPDAICAREARRSWGKGRLEKRNDLGLGDWGIGAACFPAVAGNDWSPVDRPWRAVYIFNHHLRSVTSMETAPLSGYPTRSVYLMTSRVGSKYHHFFVGFQAVASARRSRHHAITIRGPANPVIGNRNVLCYGRYLLGKILELPGWKGAAGGRRATPALPAGLNRDR